MWWPWKRSKPDFETSRAPLGLESTRQAARIDNRREIEAARQDNGTYLFDLEIDRIGTEAVFARSPVLDDTVIMQSGGLMPIVHINDEVRRILSDRFAIHADLYFGRKESPDIYYGGAQSLGLRADDRYIIRAIPDGLDILPFAICDDEPVSPYTAPVLNEALFSTTPADAPPAMSASPQSHRPAP